MYPESWSCRLIGDQNKKTLKDPLSKCSVFPMMAVLLALRACSSPVALAAFDFPRLFLDNPGIWALHAGQGSIQKKTAGKRREGVKCQCDGAWYLYNISGQWTFRWPKPLKVKDVATLHPHGINGPPGYQNKTWTSVRACLMAS